MSADLIISNIAEQKEVETKRAELSELEATLARRESELASLQAALRAFEGRYLKVVGRHYDELVEIERQIAELQGLSPDADVDDPASLADDEVGCGQNRLRSGKLRKLYRDVCRKFHPDLSADEQEREHRHRLMIEINRAYETGSEERLRALLEAGANIEVTGSVTELVLLTRLTAQARERLIAIEEEIADITASETWQLKLRAENAEAVGADLLADLVAQVERQIKKACNRLEALQSVMLTA